MCASINPIPFQPLLRFDFKPGKPASQVWLALQMMFFPIDFVGIPARPIVPSCFGLPINGWQGIVPRKAEVMARRACDRMIGNIVTIEDGWSTAGPRQVHGRSTACHDNNQPKRDGKVIKTCGILW